MATVPGVTATQTGPIGGFSAIRIRGAEGEQTLTLIDGVKINDPAAPGGGFDFANLLTGNVNSIEILRGADSVPWGSQAIGGIVNIATRRPGEGTGGGRLEYGANDRFTAVGHANYGSGAFRASLGGGYFTDDGISAAAGGTEADGYRQTAANGRIEIDIADAATVDCGDIMPTAVRIWTVSRRPFTAWPTPPNMQPHGNWRAMPGWGARRNAAAYIRSHAERH